MNSYNFLAVKGLNLNVVENLPKCQKNQNSEEISKSTINEIIAVLQSIKMEYGIQIFVTDIY